MKPWLCAAGVQIRDQIDTWYPDRRRAKRAARLHGREQNSIPASPIAASDYLKFNLIDESGNEAYGSWISSAPSAAFDITTTALNTANDWKAFFATAKAGAKTEFSFKIESAAVLTNTTATITYANL